VESAARVVEAGLPQVNLLDGRSPRALLCALFSNEGCGTRIVRAEEKS
jgi:acetylglutamate kinase